MQIRDANLSFGELARRNATNRIIVHHAEASACSAEDIHRWHLGNGWSGAGYHFLVRKDGSVWAMRPEWAVGSHAKGSNSDSIGMCFEGNYMTEDMPDAQLQAGRELIAHLKGKYGIATVQRHKDVCDTNCPGERFPWDALMSGAGKTTDEEGDDLKPINIPAGKYDVYRLYNPNAGDHFYTSSETERDALVKAGWNYEGVGWRGDDTGAIVYRLYNPNDGDHMWTVDFKEADSLRKAGWIYEGANFASARSGIPVHRLYNPNNGMHMLTVSKPESDNLVRAGWKYEGVAFYAVE